MAKVSVAKLTLKESACFTVRGDLISSTGLLLLCGFMVLDFKSL